MSKTEILEKAGRVYGSCKTDSHFRIWKKYAHLVRAATGLDNFLDSAHFRHGMVQSATWRRGND